jgi:hypothetical protein
MTRGKDFLKKVSFTSGGSFYLNESIFTIGFFSFAEG